MIAALRAGKHVACTVPMAMTLDECRAVAEAARASGRNYMMMETTVFSREFLYVQGQLRRGVIGRIQFLRGAHLQEMSGGRSDLPARKEVSSNRLLIVALMCLRDFAT